MGATAKYWDQLRQKGATLPARVEGKWVEEWPTFEEELAAIAIPEGVTAPADAVARPVLVRFDELTGAITNAAEIRNVTSQSFERVETPWKQWLGNPNSKGISQISTADHAVKLVMHTLHVAECEKEAHDGINVLYDPKLKSNVVVTTDAVEPRTIMLPPCAPIKGQLRTESTHPCRVPIYVRDPKAALDIATFYIHPEWHAPEEKLVTKAALDGAQPVEVKMPQWTGKESMHPMWAVRRVSAEEMKSKGLVPNVELEYKELPATVIYASGTITWQVKIPFLTNPDKLLAGVELIWAQHVKEKKEGQTTVNWVLDQKTSEKKQIEEKKKDAQKKRKAATLDTSVSEV